MEVTSPAQTNAQLFLQILRGGGWSPADLSLLRNSYLLAMQLYSGIYSGSGKPAIDHEIGTASLVHRHGGSPEMVVAGLLHGVYAIGEFGHFRTRINAAKRAEIRRVAGPWVEQRVYGVYSLIGEWTPATLEGLLARVPQMAELERDVLFVKLNEELDRLLDCGSLFWFRDAPRLRQRLSELRERVVLLAERLGHDALARALDEGMELTATAELPPELLGVPWPSDLVPMFIPRSCRREPLRRMYRYLGWQASRAQRLLQRRLGR